MSDFTSPPIELSRPVEVYVVRPQSRLWALHIALLLATLLTTTLVGARLYYNFVHDLPVLSEQQDALPLFPIAWVWQHPSRLLSGLPFSLSLMTILLAHEMGHFLYCRRYGVRATLPYFIPAPTLIGTFGAFIRIKSPMRSRSQLFDIGIAGPIAGFVVATLVLFASLPLAKPLAASAFDQTLQFGYPAVFGLAKSLLASWSPMLRMPMEKLYLHPVTISAWVGMFATALNLLPGGQLDGGHIIYSIRPRIHRLVSRLAVVALIPMAWYFWAGWLVWAVLLFISGVRHPRLPSAPDLSFGRKLLAVFGLLMLVVTFSPHPIKDHSLKEVVYQLRHPESLSTAR
jgi:membrane-associated protease RseP (regulator of RpoE activity)